LLKGFKKVVCERAELTSIMWIACFAPPSDGIYRVFSDLTERLERSGVRLVVFSSNELSSHDYQFYSIKVPFLIAETGSEFGEFFNGEAVPGASAVLKEFIASDKVWGLQTDFKQAELETLRAVSFWERAFSLMQPSAILSWGSTSPLSRIWFYLARRFQRPHFVIERGVMENTLSYAVAGQGALSDFSTSLSMVDPGREDDSLGERWRRIEHYYANPSFGHYPDVNKPLDDRELQVLNETSKPRILYLGSFDAGSGARFDYRELGDLHAPWVQSSEAGAKVLVDCLKTLRDFNGSLILKPHPADYFDLHVDAPFPVHCFRNANVYQLIEKADVVVTLTSSTAFMALLKGVPTITLANIQFMGRAATYEARSPEELISAVENACAKNDWNERLVRGRSLIAAAFRDTLIGLDDEVPTRFKVRDFAELLGRFKYYTPSDVATADERLTLFEEFYKLARGRSPRDDQFMTSTVRDLDRERAELSRHLEQARREVATQERRLSVLDQALSERTNALDSLMARFTEQMEKTAGLDQTLSERTNALDSLRARFAEQMEKIARLDQTLLERTEALNGLSRELVERDAHIASLNSTVADMLASASWRITSPLRAASRLLRRAITKAP